jgi:hypothetical protein
MSYELDAEDKKRISHNKEYRYAKRIYESHDRYQDVEIGEVYTVRRIGYNDLFVCHYGNTPTRFYIINKDEGFAFAKRISSNGKLGKQVICMTTEYPLDDKIYELVPDDAYVESMLLGTEYDPSADGKAMVRRKNKARAHNNRLFINKISPVEAKNYIDNLKVGDKIWDAGTKFGSGIVEWTITNIENRPVDKTQATPRYHWEPTYKHKGKTKEDRAHNQYGFSDVVIITVQPNKLDSARRYVREKTLTFMDLRYVREKTLTFMDFFGNHKWYGQMPKTPGDFDA